MAQQAARDMLVTKKAEGEAGAGGKHAMAEQALSPNSLEYPLPMAPVYELDSQTIVVDWVADTKETVAGHDGGQIIL